MEEPHKTLDEMLGKLPREVAVPRNLWPAIAHRIGRRARNVRSFGLAASVAVVCMAGALSWAVWHGRPAARITSAETGVRAPSFDEPNDPAYLAARLELERSFRERLATLEPHTRAKIETSLALIRRTHEEIRRALAAQPANPVLEHLLESTWHDEFDLYDDVVRGTQPNLLRS